MNVEVLLFDIGGTVFDWRSSVINSLENTESADLRSADKEAFSKAWRRQSLIEVETIARSDAEWRPFDEILRTSLDHTLSDLGFHNIPSPTIESLIRSWEQMPAWPEARNALDRMRQKYFIAPHTVLSLRVAAYSSRNAGITWDAIISCDGLKAMKPNKESYRRVLDLLRRPPEQICFVASHPSDLRAASCHGMKTAYVVARLEDYGDDYHDTGFSDEFDLVADNFEDLASKMGCL